MIDFFQREEEKTERLTNACSYYGRRGKKKRPQAKMNDKSKSNTHKVLFIHIFPLLSFTIYWPVRRMWKYAYYYYVRTDSGNVRHTYRTYVEDAVATFGNNKNIKKESWKRN